MRNLWAIYRKEMQHYFVSPVAYILIGVFLALSAFFFNPFLNSAIMQQQQSAMEGMQMGMMQNFDVPTAVVRATFGLLSTFALFFTPMLTMGVYAEERRRGTMELLMTSPVSEIEIVLGKYLASLTLWVIMFLPTALGLTYMFVHSEPTPPWKMLLAAYAGVLLLGGAFLALGTFISSLTENQLIAAVITFAAFLVLWVVDAGANADGGVGTVRQYLSVIHRYDDFSRGVLDTSALIYYLSFIVFFVFLTVRSVDSMRWRRA
jgi:ABC-2 type transport system permease protein